MLVRWEVFGLWLFISLRPDRTGPETENVVLLRPMTGPVKPGPDRLWTGFSVFFFGFVYVVDLEAYYIVNLS